MGLFLCMGIALTRCLCSLCSFLQNGNSPSSFSIYIGLSETSQSNSFDSRHRRERSSSDTGHCTAPLIHTHSLVVDRRAPAKVARGCSDGRASSTSISLSGYNFVLCFHKIYQHTEDFDRSGDVFLVPARTLGRVG